MAPDTAATSIAAPTKAAPVTRGDSTTNAAATPIATLTDVARDDIIKMIECWEEALHQHIDRCFNRLRGLNDDVTTDKDGTIDDDGYNNDECVVDDGYNNDECVDDDG